MSRLTAEAIRRLDTCPVPTLALIQGGCFGGGTGIAAACDVVVASEDAIFSISETRWGLMAGIILPQLCQAMGLRQVRRYALTGERFGAQEARRLGLVHEVCPTGGLAAAGEKIVEAVLMNAPGPRPRPSCASLAAASAFVDDGELRDLIDEHARTRQQDEAREGLASFKEKRKPSLVSGLAAAPRNRRTASQYMRIDRRHRVDVGPFVGGMHVGEAARPARRSSARRAPPADCRCSTGRRPRPGRSSEAPLRPRR